MEGADGAAVAARDELVDLLDAAVPVPPGAPTTRARELAALGERPVRVLGGRRDPGVLPPRDAEGVEVFLREEDRPLPLLARRARDGCPRTSTRRPRAGCPWAPRRGSRSILPSHGSGVSRVMCPTSNALGSPTRRGRHGSAGRRAGRGRGRRAGPWSACRRGSGTSASPRRRSTARRRAPGRTPPPRRGTRPPQGGRGATRGGGSGRRTARGDGSPGTPGAPSAPGGGGAPSRSGTAPHGRFRAHRDDPIAADRHGTCPPARRVHRGHVGAGDREVGGPGGLRHRAEDSPRDHRRRRCTASAVV